MTPGLKKALLLDIWDTFLPIKDNNVKMEAELGTHMFQDMLVTYQQSRVKTYMRRLMVRSLKTAIEAISTKVSSYQTMSNTPQRQRRLMSTQTPSKNKRQLKVK